MNTRILPQLELRNQPCGERHPDTERSGATCHVCRRLAQQTAQMAQYEAWLATAR